MWRLSTAIMLALANAKGQPMQELLLPQARHIVGIVVDSEGKPIAGAHIDHIGRTPMELPQTGSNGKFELDTRAPAIVIRKAGFQSHFIPTEDARHAHITLTEAHRFFPTCPDDRSYVGFEGWGAGFQFLNIAGVKVSRQGHDVDYAIRFYYVESKHGIKGIRHGRGPTWDYGTPSDEDVWRSVGLNYEEITYDNGGIMIVAARGEFSNGSRWRYLGKFGESADYSDVDPETAKTLDKFLDGACFKRSPRQ